MKHFQTFYFKAMFLAPSFYLMKRQLACFLYMMLPDQVSSMFMETSTDLEPLPG